MGLAIFFAARHSANFISPLYQPWAYVISSVAFHLVSCNFYSNRVLLCINTISSKGRIRQILFLLCVRIWFLRGAKQSGAALINKTSTNSKNGICRILPLLLVNQLIQDCSYITRAMSISGTKDLC